MVTYRRSRTNIRKAPVRRRRLPARRAPARRSYRRARIANRRKHVCGDGQLTPSAKFVMAQLDPFEPSVSGAKIPDSNTFPSIATTDFEINSITGPAAAANLVGAAYRPQYTWGTINATPAAAAVDWGAGFSANAVNRTRRSAYGTAIELTRPVAHAVRISSQLAPTTASGFVHLALSTESLYGASTWTFPTTLAQMSGLQYYKRVTLASLTQSPLTVINKWIDDTAFRYSDPTGNVATAGGASFQTDYSWGTIVIIVEGAPVTTSNVLSVENILLSEGIPQKDGVIIGTPAAANSPGTLGAAGQVTTDMEPFHTEAEQDSYISRGVQAVVTGSANAGEAVFSQVALPLLQRTAYAMTGTALTMAMNAIRGTGGISGVNSNPNRLAI